MYCCNTKLWWSPSTHWRFINEIIIIIISIIIIVVVVAMSKDALRPFHVDDDAGEQETSTEHAQSDSDRHHNQDS